MVVVGYLLQNIGAFQSLSADFTSTTFFLNFTFLFFAYAPSVHRIKSTQKSKKVGDLLWSLGHSDILHPFHFTFSQKCWGGSVSFQKTKNEKRTFQLSERKPFFIIID